MPKSYLTIAVAMAISFTMATTVFARGMGGGPHGFARPSGGPPIWQGSSPPGFSRGAKTGWHGGSVPPGWTKGKKKGWNGQSAPSGLYGR